MASRSFLSLFLQTHEHLEVADRTQRFTVLALLLFHLALLWPFAATSRLEEQRQAEARELDTSLATLEESAERLEASHTRALQTLGPALERLVHELRLDFIQLDAALVELRTATTEPGVEETAADGEEEEGAAADTPEDNPGEDSNPWLTILDVPMVREAQNRYSLLTALEPLIDQQLLAPRFATLTEVWTQKTRSPFEGEIERLTNQLSTLRARRDDPAAIWDDLIAALGGLRRAVLEFEITPPERAYWWASPEDVPELRIGLDPATMEELRSPRALDELRVMVARTLEHRGALEKALRVARQDLAKTSAANSGGTGGRVFGLDLSSLLQIWPLLLGLLLAMAVFHRSQRLRQLGLLTTLMVEHGAPPNLKRWFLAEMRGNLTPAMPSEPLARACLLRGLGTLVAGWLWIALATLQVHGSRADLLTKIRDPTAGWPALAGAAALLFAVLHRLYLNGQLIDLLREDLIEPLPELEVDEGDDEPFDIQDLRR